MKYVVLLFNLVLNSMFTLCKLLLPQKKKKQNCVREVVRLGLMCQKLMIPLV